MPSTRPPTDPRRPLAERGSALMVLLVLSAAVGAMITTFLGRTWVEQRNVNFKASLERAHWRSVGQLELARNVISTSTYTNGQNDAIQAALATPNGFVEGTSVIVEAAGPNRWYRLVSVASCEGVLGVNVVFVRDGASYVSYNYYVERHAIGVSGQPQGKIHSNDQVEFFFQDGLYVDPVSATNGFEYEQGATPDNTRLVGGADPAAPAKTLLQDLSLGDLEAAAAWVAPANVDAEVTFLGSQVKVDLYQPSDSLAPVVTKRSVCVSVNPVTALDGTQTWVPVYQDVAYTRYNCTLAGQGQLISTTLLPAAGILYFPGRIRAVSGDLDGRVTVVSGGKIEVSGPIRYVDSAGMPAWVNGVLPQKPYEPNPLFRRDGQSLALVALDDVRYSKSSDALEVNGMLLSKEGTVSYVAVQLDALGNAYVQGPLSVRGCLRRFGGVLSAERPVSTVVDADGRIIHGYRSGTSVYDAAAALYPPPGIPEEPTVLWSYAHRVDRSDLTDAGVGVAEADWTRLDSLLDLNLIEVTAEVLRTAEDGGDWDVWKVDTSATSAVDRTITCGHLLIK